MIKLIELSVIYTRVRSLSSAFVKPFYPAFKFLYESFALFPLFPGALEAYLGRHRMKQPRHAILVVLILLAMIAWGGSWTSGKLLANEASPEVLTFWRFLITAISFFPILISQRRRAKLDWFTLRQTLFGALCIVGYNTMFFRGLKTGLAGAGGVLVTSLNPILTSLFAAFFFQRRLERRTILGLVLGFCGGMILLEVWSISPEKLLHSGNAFLVIASACWALLTITSEKSKERIPLLIFSFYVYAFATILVAPLAAPRQIAAAWHYGASFWLNVGYLSALATTFATTIYFLASNRLGSGRASSFIFTVPVSAVLISWLITGEVPRLVTLMGGAVGMAAVYLINSRAPARSEDKSVDSSATPDNGFA